MMTVMILLLILTEQLIFNYLKNLIITKIIIAWNNSHKKFMIYWECVIKLKEIVS